MMTMDLIDRDALEPFYESGTDPNDTYADMTFIRVEHIENAPSVNRWISVEEGLPDSKEDVLVWFEYFRYGEYDCLYQTYGIGNYYKNYDDWTVNHESGWDQLRVIAWMPLPEPPEKE